MTASTARPAWKALAAHHATLRDAHLRDLFAADPGRGERFSAEAAGLYLDYAKQRVTDETLQLLVALAEEADLAGRIAAMFRGDKINVTENRAVMHTALRAPRRDVPRVSDQLDRGPLGPARRAADAARPLADRRRDRRREGLRGDDEQGLLGL